MKILIDMNLSPRWTEVFLENNIEAVHWSGIGSAHANDAEILNYAKAHGYVVFTHDLDFSTILAKTNSHKPSVIQIRVGDLSPTMVARQVIGAIRTAFQEIEEGALVTIDINKTRLRILPMFPEC